MWCVRHCSSEPSQILNVRRATAEIMDSGSRQSADSSRSKRASFIFAFSANSIALSGTPTAIYHHSFALDKALS